MQKPIPTMEPSELRAIRDELGLTQIEMAERLGVKLRGYRAWEAESGMSKRAISGPAVLLVRRLLDEYRSKK
jgi:DNA-binding transcriptional regulator YiaG